MPSFDDQVRFLPNPFNDIIAPDTLAAGDPGAPMFEEVMIGWTKAVAEMEATPPQGRSVILAAASGVGKTHLLLRFRLAMRGRAVFARIYPWPSADVFHRNLLHHLVRDWAKPWDEETPGPLFDLAAAVGDAEAFDPLRRALGLLSDPGAADPALRWLKGQSVEDDALHALNLPVIEDDLSARRLLFDLLGLMVPLAPVVLAFDQLDSAPRDAQGAPDIQPLLDFNTKLRDTAALAPRVLAILSLLDENWRRLKLNDGQKSDLDRLDKRKGYSFQLKGSTAEECRAIARLRLAPLHQAAAEAGADVPADPLHPLAAAYLTDAIVLGARTVTPIRDFLRYAGGLYLAYKRDLEGFPSEGELHDPLRSLWLETRAEAERDLERDGVNDSEALRGLVYAWSGMTGRELPADAPALRAPYGSFGRLTPDGRLAVWFEDASNLRFYHLMVRVQEKTDRRTLFFRANPSLPKVGLKGRELFDALFVGHAVNRFIAPTQDMIVMAVACRKMVGLLETGDVEDLSLHGLLTHLNDFGAFLPLARQGRLQGEPGDGAMLLKAQDIVEDYVRREQLIGWPHVRDRLAALLPAADSAVHTQAVAGLIGKHKLRWLNPDAPLSQRILTLAQA